MVKVHVTGYKKLKSQLLILQAFDHDKADIKLNIDEDWQNNVLRVHAACRVSLYTQLRLVLGNVVPSKYVLTYFILI